ncbi:ferrous iron transport protein B [Ectothiorhodospira magna]|uniref:Ferrous iron transport protein B n=1 Tax=Ectothiorhodospira magna TaxID=867345 RepID=A0A1H9GA38_9GAMM|nr:ferrous iron transport protein B [Ectothiorhodospira magna]SEQ46956.1 ferrous iron transport protein B [Ectothiorhodospira magna]
MHTIPLTTARPGDIRGGIALIGQPNCGKSTLFNALTGLRQHVANYPGVTVEKKQGPMHLGDRRLNLVDLPGTYSLTAFSPEERVVRSFLLDSPPTLGIHVLDAAQLQRGLSLTFQLLEMGLPVICALNMSDVVRRQGHTLDPRRLAELLGVPVVETVGRRGQGLDQLKREISGLLDGGHRIAARLPRYGALEPHIQAIMERLPDSLKNRWMALRLLENDPEGKPLLLRHGLAPESMETLLAEARDRRDRFQKDHDQDLADYVIMMRDRHAHDLTSQCLNTGAGGQRISWTERADRILLNRWLAPVFLLATIYVIYHTAIVQGYELTQYTWPLLAGVRNLAADWLPAAGFLHDPLSRSLGLWLLDSVNTLLNYVPIFLILFALIAILEDSGYMARIAFILDRVLHRFGLHGQSTLPLILGGVFAGGCAVPGVMATRAIPDPRARLATILTVPYMNCLAKIPLYTLLIGIFFVDHKGLIMFFIATITIMVALLVAWLLTRTLLRPMETVPFVMEMPRYHLPTAKGVMRRALDRTWLYIKKVGTIVLAVAVVIFVLLNLPGLSAEEQENFEQRAQIALNQFHDQIHDNPHAHLFQTPEQLMQALSLSNAYRARRMNLSTPEAVQSLDRRFEQADPIYFPFVRPGGGDRDVRAINRALRTLDQERRLLRLEMQETRIHNSLLGRTGQALEPLTRAAGFDWKINVALLSSFAARESAVATLGVLFQQEEGASRPLEERMGTAMGGSEGALVALALIVFFAIYPPCLATAIMVRVQTDSTGWMLFSIVFPAALGLLMASAIHSLGQAFTLDAIHMMIGFWVLILALLLMVGLWPRRRVKSGLATATPGNRGDGSP